MTPIMSAWYPTCILGHWSAHSLHIPVFEVMFHFAASLRILSLLQRALSLGSMSICSRLLGATRIPETPLVVQSALLSIAPAATHCLLSMPAQALSGPARSVTSYDQVGVGCNDMCIGSPNLTATFLGLLAHAACAALHVS